MFMLHGWEYMTVCIMVEWAEGFAEALLINSRLQTYHLLHHELYHGPL